MEKKWVISEVVLRFPALLSMNQHRKNRPQVVMKTHLKSCFQGGARTCPQHVPNNTVGLWKAICHQWQHYCFRIMSCLLQIQLQPALLKGIIILCGEKPPSFSHLEVILFDKWETMSLSWWTKHSLRCSRLCKTYLYDAFTDTVQILTKELERTSWRTFVRPPVLLINDC